MSAIPAWSHVSALRLTQPPSNCRTPFPNPRNIRHKMPKNGPTTQNPAKVHLSPSPTMIVLPPHPTKKPITRLHISQPTDSHPTRASVPHASASRGGRSTASPPACPIILFTLVFLCRHGSTESLCLCWHHLPCIHAPLLAYTGTTVPHTCSPQAHSAKSSSGVPVRDTPHVQVSL